MARSSIARSCSVWRFSPVESVCVGRIWGPRRLPMERSDMVTPHFFFLMLSRTDINKCRARNGRWRQSNSSHAHVSQFCRVQHASAWALFNHACTRDSSHFALLIFGVVCHIAHPKHLFIFDVSSQISRSPSWVFLLVPQATRSTKPERTSLTGIRTHSSATSLEGQSGFLADPILLTLHRGEAKCFDPNAKVADLWFNIWEDPFWRHDV